MGRTGTGFDENNDNLDEIKEKIKTEGRSPELEKEYQLVASKVWRARQTDIRQYLKLKKKRDTKIKEIQEISNEMEPKAKILVSREKDPQYAYVPVYIRFTDPWELGDDCVIGLDPSKKKLTDMINKLPQVLVDNIVDFFDGSFVEAEKYL